MSGVRSFVSLVVTAEDVGQFESRPRRLILKLLLPGVNLVGMDLVALRKLRGRSLFPAAPPARSSPSA